MGNDHAEHEIGEHPVHAKRAPPGGIGKKGLEGPLFEQPAERDRSSHDSRSQHCEEGEDHQGAERVVAQMAAVPVDKNPVHMVDDRSG